MRVIILPSNFVLTMAMLACTILIGALPFRVEAQITTQCPQQGATMQNGCDCKDSTYLIDAQTIDQHRQQGGDPPGCWRCGRSDEDTATGCLNDAGLAGVARMTGGPDPYTPPSDNHGGSLQGLPGGI